MRNFNDAWRHRAEGTPDFDSDLHRRNDFQANHINEFREAGVSTSDSGDDRRYGLIVAAILVAEGEKSRESIVGILRADFIGALDRTPTPEQIQREIGRIEDCLDELVSSQLINEEKGVLSMNCL